MSKSDSEQNRQTSYEQLPEHLPEPIDDGACQHLTGQRLPALNLPSTQGQPIALDQQQGWWLIFCYPRTGQPNQALPQGWDSLPGARGCTPQACASRDQWQGFTQRGVQVFGLSTQTTAYQQEAAQRLHLPYPLLSDEQGLFLNALSLPTFEVEGMQLIKRLTLIVFEQTIQHVHYPVFPSDRDAEYCLAWLDNQHG